ncbi:MAG TPA: double zinc ribbon domain-containing protein, partial [Candidatus Binataceae bacterium]|nr:double zinc ribbon domain-containing protein [Candidatus Binataceae bacterium]
MLRYLVNFIYPPRCASCDRRFTPDVRRRLCIGCIGRLEALPEPLCAVCGVPIAAAGGEGEGWCGRCTESPPHFGRARAVARYRAGSDEDAQMLPKLIRRHKYGLDQSLAYALAECLGDPLPVEGNDYDLI